MDNRINWIQVAKGIGIVLVIFGHTLTTTLREHSNIAMNIYDYIYFFHMAFFFYISGRTFMLSKNKQRVKGIIRTKFNRLLIPYLFYATFVYLIFVIINVVPLTGGIAKAAGYNIQPIGTWIISLVTGEMKFTSHLWFVYVLFLMQVFTELIISIFKAKAFYINLFLSSVFLILSQIIYIPGFEVINRFMLLYIWFIIGRSFDFSTIRFTNAIVCGMIGNIYWIFRYGLSFSSIFIDTNSNLLQRYCDQIVKLVFIIFLVKLATVASGRIEKILVYLGNNSFNIYLLHQPFFCSTVSVMLLKLIGVHTILIIFITFAIALISTLFVIKVLSIGKIKKISNILLGIR